VLAERDDLVDDGSRAQARRQRRPVAHRVEGVGRRPRMNFRQEGCRRFSLVISKRLVAGRTALPIPLEDSWSWALVGPRERPRPEASSAAALHGGRKPRPPAESG